SAATTSPSTRAIIRRAPPLAERLAAQPRAALPMLPPSRSACPPLVGCSGLLGCRVNREWALTEVRGKGRVPPRVTLKRQFSSLEERDKSALDVRGTALDRRLATHNPRIRHRRVAHGQEVADPGVLARHEAGGGQQLLDLVGAHVRPKEHTQNLTLELNE
ncbi:MAG: hypothetical protein LC130_12340, partial [Bryobacterales bacterium]|nr:hypothetical protein [Bryobacterales bacterium]